MNDIEKRLDALEASREFLLDTFKKIEDNRCKIDLGGRIDKLEKRLEVLEKGYRENHECFHKKLNNRFESLAKQAEADYVVLNKKIKKLKKTVKIVKTIRIRR